MSESTDKPDGCVIFGFAFLAFTIGVLVGGFTEQHLTSDPLKAKAIEVGAAEWHVNPKDVDHATITTRIAAGWTIEQALTLTPDRGRRVAC